MFDKTVSPERILGHATGVWATAVLTTAVRKDLFTLIEGGASTADAIAGAASISPRGAQALLDGLVGLGLLSVAGGSYANTPETAMFLVRGQPAYIGEWITFHAAEMPAWHRLEESVSTGDPVLVEADKAENVAELALALAPLAVPVILAAGERLGIAGAGPIRILDVGGGSGVFSAFWLNANEEARSTQIDQPGVNAAARRYVESFGVGDRFRTVDGDAAVLDWGTGEYDVGVFSHVAHALGPEENVGAFRKFRKALRTGGTLLVTDFVLADDRTGPPMGLLFHANMLIHTARGAPWREADFRAWLLDAGFTDVDVETGSAPVPIIYAR